MEVITRVATGVGLISLWLIAGLAKEQTLARIRCAPTATLVFTKIIAMRVLDYSKFGYFGFF